MTSVEIAPVYFGSYAHGVQTLLTEEAAIALRKWDEGGRQSDDYTTLLELANGTFCFLTEQDEPTTAQAAFFGCNYRYVVGTLTAMFALCKDNVVVNHDLPPNPVPFGEMPASFLDNPELFYRTKIEVSKAFGLV